MRLPSADYFDEPALVRINLACKYLSLGRSKLYELIRKGQLEAVGVDGKSVRITTESIKRFMGGLPPITGGSPIKRDPTRPAKERISLKDLGL
jgi:excisionase family DNA binding protein